MARVLRRPMFRLGGNTDQGIMSGVAPRQGYANGGDYKSRVLESARGQEEIMKELIGQRPDPSLSNLAIDWGLRMASAEPSGSIFSTAAKEAIEPFEKYKASKAQRGAFEQQIGLTAATSAIEQENQMLQIALKNLTKDERIMMEKRARLLAENLDISFAEALKMELYKKREDPAEARKTGIEEMAMRMALEDDDSGVKYEYFLPIARTIQQAIDGAYDDPKAINKSEEISNRLDLAQKYIVEDDIGERQGDDTYGITVNMPEGDYINDKVYYNPKDNSFYVYNGSTRTFHIVILPGQEAIKHAPTFE